MTRSHLRSFVALAVAVATAAGCASVLGPEWRRELGGLDTDGTLRGSLYAPAEVTRGAPFHVVVTTYGSSSCTRPAGATTAVDGRRAVVRPYDRVPHGDALCTSDLAAFPRAVRLRFDAVGEATIRVLGRDGAQVEQRVTVRP